MILDEIHCLLKCVSPTRVWSTEWRLIKCFNKTPELLLINPQEIYITHVSMLFLYYVIYEYNNTKYTLDAIYKNKYKLVVFIYSDSCSRVISRYYLKKVGSNLQNVRYYKVN